MKRAVEASQRLGIDELEPTRINHLFITHLHSVHLHDHAELGWTRWWEREQSLSAWNPAVLDEMTRHARGIMAVDQEAQDGIRERLEKAGYEAPDMHVLNHGYCYSLYMLDPAKLLIELNVDHEDIDKIMSARMQRRTPSRTGGSRVTTRPTTNSSIDNGGNG